jgi:two-component system alkaline phosphatase synthesis response regulator PhoP
MKTKKVLIVEDNELNRRLFENLIGQNYEYKHASNGIEALQKLEIENFDLVLLDIQMPKMDGITLLKKIKQNPLAVYPVIAISAHAEDSDRQRFIQIGFDDFISKPIRPREFLETINRIIYSKTEKQREESQDADVILDKKIMAQLMKFSTNDSIQKVYRDFIKECEQTWKTLQTSLEINELKPISEKLHILKGNSGTLGANRIYQLSQKTELAAKTGNLNSLKNYLPILKKEIDLFKNFIKEETNFEL